MFKRLSKNKFLLVIIIAVFLLFPSAIGKSSIANTNVLVVAMGIDKIGQEYETSLMIIVPKQSGSFNQSLEVISAKGETVRQSLNQLSLHTGKRIGLGHCGMIIVNDEALKEDIVMVLDYVLRDTQVDNSCVLVNTNNSSKELLEANKKLQNQYGVDTAKMLDFTNNYVFLEQTNIEEVINSKLSNNYVSFMSYISLSDKPEEGLDTKQEDGGNSGGGGDPNNSSSGGGSSGGGSGSSDSKEKSVVSNIGQIALLLDGKKVAVANQEIMKGLYWLSDKQSSLEFMVDPYSDDKLTDAKISFVVKSKKHIKEYTFKDGKPKVNIKVSADVKLSEIVQKDEADGLFISYEDYVTEEMKKAVEEEIRSKIQNCIDFLTANKTDIIQVYRGFEKYKYKEWLKFLSTLDDKKNFLEYVDFEIEVELKSKQ